MSPNIGKAGNWNKINLLSTRTEKVRKEFDSLIHEKDFFKSSQEILKFVDQCFDGNSTLSMEKEECGVPADAHYVMKRLIGGLCSEGHHARGRHGCYATLETVLQLHPSLFNCAVLLIEKVFEKGEDGVSGAYFLGQALAYGALIRSGCLLQNEKLKEEIIGKFFILRGTKSYMESIVGQFIVNLFTMSPDKNTAKLVWDRWRDEISGDINDLGLCSLWIRLILTRPEYVKELEISDDLVEQTYSAESYRVFHDEIWELHASGSNAVPIMEDLFLSLSFLKAEKVGADNIVEFFIEYFVPSLKKNTAKRSNFVLNAIQIVLNYLNTGDQFSAVLCPSIIQQIIDGSQPSCDSSVAANTRGLCTTIHHALQVHKSNSLVQLAIIKKLITHPGSVRFDKITKMKLLQMSNENFCADTVIGLVNILEENIKADKYELLKRLRGQPLFSGDLLASAQLISYIVHHPRVSNTAHLEWKADRAEFLLRTTYTRNHPQREKDHLRDAYRKCLKISTKKLSEHVMFVEKIVTKVSESMNSANNGAYRLKPDEVELFRKAAHTVEKLGTKKHSQDVEYMIFRLLYSQLSLHIFADSTSAEGLLSDLDHCYKKAKEQKKNTKRELKASRDTGAPTDSQTEAEWIGVIVDLLLSFLSKGDQFWKSVVLSSFRILCHMVFPQSLTLLTDVLDPEKEDTILQEGNESDEESMDEEEESMISGKSDEESDEESDFGEEEDEEEEMSEKTAEILAIKMKMHSIVGPVDNELDMDVMTEEDMDGLDKSLSELFKSYRKVATNKQNLKNKNKLSIEKTSLMHFRTRVCDVLDELISEAPSPEHLIVLIVPLLKALKWTLRSNLQVQLHNRLVTLVSNLSQTKKFTVTDTLTTGFAVESLNKMYAVGKRLPVELSKQVGLCSTFLVRTGLTILPEPDREYIIEAYVNNFEQFLMKRGWNVNEEAVTGPIFSNSSTHLAILNILKTHGFENVTSKFKPCKTHFDMLKIILFDQASAGKIPHRDLEHIQQVMCNGMSNLLERTAEKQQICTNQMIPLLEFLRLLYSNHMKNTGMRAGFNWEKIIESIIVFYKALSKAQYKNVHKTVVKLATQLKIELPKSEKPSILKDSTEDEKQVKRARSESISEENVAEKESKTKSRKKKFESESNNLGSISNSNNKENVKQKKLKNKVEIELNKTIPADTTKKVEDNEFPNGDTSCSEKSEKLKKKLEKKLDKQKRKEEKAENDESEKKKRRGKSKKKSKREERAKLNDVLETKHSQDGLKNFSFLTSGLF